MAQERRRALPGGVEVGVPSARVLTAVLGLYRTGATLRRGRLLTLELGLEELAELLGVAKSTVALAVRWLGCEDFEAAPGVMVRALGFVQRVRRAAMAELDGVRRKVYRTSKSFLTEIGKQLLGVTDCQRIARWAQRHERRVRSHQQGAADKRWRAEHDKPPPPPELPPGADERAAGLAWLRQIRTEVLA